VTKVIPPDNPLTAGQRRVLLSLARRSVVACVRGEDIGPVEVDDPRLQEPRGVFVTLTKKGQLRGCIGQFEAAGPLWDAVIDRARASALEDPRFPPVSADELPEIHIEISALTPLRKIRSIQEIEVGRHGIYISHGSWRGTLLPQVATERGWDRETFLSQLCAHKAGLPPNAWKAPGTELHIFTATVFSENEIYKK